MEVQTSHCSAPGQHGEPPGPGAGTQGTGEQPDLRAGWRPVATPSPSLPELPAPNPTCPGESWPLGTHPPHTPCSSSSVFRTCQVDLPQAGSLISLDPGQLPRTCPVSLSSKGLWWPEIPPPPLMFILSSCLPSLSCPLLTKMSLLSRETLKGPSPGSPLSSPPVDPEGLCMPQSTDPILLEWTGPVGDHVALSVEAPGRRQLGFHRSTSRKYFTGAGPA